MVSYLKLRLKKELLRTLRAVVDLVFLAVHGKNVLLQLVGLHKHWEKDEEEKVRGCCR